MAPPMCRSTNRLGTVPEPKICFRIVHVSGEGHHDGRGAAYGEQTVEIALAPDEWGVPRPFFLGCSQSDTLWIQGGL